MVSIRTSRRARVIASAAAAVAVLLPSLAAADAADRDFAYNQQPSSPWQQDQTGANNCVERWGQSSDQAMCQTAVINSADDFCLWGPPTFNDISHTERIEVAYCTKPGYGSRLIPDGTLTSVHFTKAQNYVQIIATGDFSKININPNSPDGGGELDPHGADGNGNPEGGLVYTNAFGLTNGQPKQVHQWMSFMSGRQACFRACLGGSDQLQRQLCEHIYDVMGCEWNMPSTKYNEVSFDSCDGDNGEPPGQYGASKWYQGDCGAACAPAPHPPPALSNCKNVPSPANNLALPASTGASQSASGTTSGAPAPTSASGTGSSSSPVMSSVRSPTASPSPANANANTAGGSSGAAALGASSGVLLAGTSAGLASIFAALLML